MEQETKNIPWSVKASAQDGTFEGRLSVYGVVDQGGDVVEPGAFTRTIKAQNGMVPLLWQHKSDSPIGTLTLEDRADGLYVKGRLILAVTQAQDAYHLLKAGVIRGLSIGYQAVQKSMKDGVRHLSEINLFEGSIVTFPMAHGAVVTGIKAADDITSIRAFESFLHEAGWSKAQAKRLASAGWNAGMATPDDDPESELVDWLQGQLG